MHLLGGFEVEGVESRRFGSRKARTLLKVLALARGAAVSPDRLADHLWPDDPPARPTDQVSVLVSRLRGTLGTDRLPRSDAGYALRVDWLDLAELEARADETGALLAAGNLAAARAVAAAALSLVRGELLADESDAPWAEADRAAAARLVARVRLLVAEASLRSGEPLHASEQAGAALDHDPYDEAALRLLMRSHVAAGRPASALAAYSAFRERVAEELGASPTAETESLHTGIVRDEHVEPRATVVARPHRALPGRALEIAALDAALEQASAGRLVVLGVHGEAGIGKTTLIETWAEAANERGAVVLLGRCEPLGRALPLQPVADALELHLRSLDPGVAEAVLGDDAAVLAGVLGRRPTSDVVLDVLADPSWSRAAVFEALLDAVVRAGDSRPTVLVLDDLHAAGTSTLEWLRFAVRRGAGRPLLVIVAWRSGEGSPLELPGPVLELGPLDEEAVAAVVGRDRAAALHARSGGHPLFLVELAAAPAGELPRSIRDAVGQRCEAAGPDVAGTLRTAAVLGSTVDVDLLAAVLGRPVAVLVEHLEEGVRSRLLEEGPGGFAFGHEVVQQAVAADISAARRALVHREAAVVLARRPGTDPLTVAHHAHLGGDVEREAAALGRAAAMAVDRFDYDTADTLLGTAIERRDATEPRLTRARVRLMLGRFDAAQEDAMLALAAGAGAEAMEVAAWIAYRRRDYAAAVRLAADGVRLADDDVLRARCLTVLGRSRHNLGELAQAETNLRQAVTLVTGPESTAPSVWLGALLVHTGATDEGLEHLRPATRPGISDPLSRAPIYAYMFSAYGHALQGRPQQALALLDPIPDEVGRRHDAGLLGFAQNFRAWILRNLGASSEADDTNLAALDAVPAAGAEPNVHALLDLAAGRLLAADADGARRRLAEVDDSLPEWSTFVWRARLRRLHLSVRLALLEEDWELTHALAGELAEDAVRFRTRRYGVMAGLLDAEAAARSGEAIDRDRVDRLLGELWSVAALESWWLTGDIAQASGEPRWSRLAHERAAMVATEAGPHADTLIQLADRRFR